MLGIDIDKPFEKLKKLEISMKKRISAPSSEEKANYSPLFRVSLSMPLNFFE